MKIMMTVFVDNVEKYEGKKGLGANVTVSKIEGRSRKNVTFNCNDVSKISILESYLQEECIIEVDLIQSNFGLRLGEVFGVTPINS